MTVVIRDPLLDLDSVTARRRALKRKDHLVDDSAVGATNATPLTWEPLSLREVNTKAILSLLRLAESPVSRQHLAESSGLSLVTVGKIVRHLVEAGLVVEVGSDRGGGGRPVGLLQLNAQGGHVFGVLVRADSLVGVVMNLRGAVIHDLEVAADYRGLGPELVTRLTSFIQDLIGGSPIPGPRIVGGGLGVPGLIDAQEGRCLQSWALDLRDTELTKPLEHALGVPVLLDNDANCLGAFELLFGRLLGRKHGLVISVGAGLGMCVVVDGLIYRGTSGMAGDFGHAAVLGAHDPCECGRVGCLELYCSDRGVERNYQRATGRALPLTDIAALAEKADPAAQGAFREAGTVLGYAVSTAVQTLDPAEVVIVVTDGMARSNGLVEASALEVLEVQLRGRPGKPPCSLEQVGYERWAHGAASLSLRSLFTPGALGVPALGHLPLG